VKKVTEEKEKKEKGEGKEVYPGASGVNDAQVFAKMQDFSSKFYTNASDALAALKRQEAKVLVFNLENPTRYVYVTLFYANPNYFLVKEFSEDQVFAGDYSAELQKMTEEQVINLLLSGKD
jgi:hypothetical protein